jgi:hypothetical protein
MCEELPNGGAERRLASGEGMAVAHLVIGEKAAERGKLRLPSAFIVGGEREGATVVSHVGNKTPAACRSGSTMMRAGFPYPKSLMGGLRSAFEPVARVGKVFGLHCSRAQAC